MSLSPNSPQSVLRVSTRSLVPRLAVLLGCVGTATAGDVTGFTVIDARSNRPVGTLVDGGTLDRSKYGGSVSVRADVGAGVKSVRFEVDGAVVRTESTAPYSVSGDNDGKYGPWALPAGKHTLKATPYPLAGAKGKPGKALVVRFTISGAAAGGGGRRNRIDRGVPPALEPVAKATTVQSGSVEVEGELKTWHRVTLSFGGPASSETATPNPFADHRLIVTFTNGKKTYVVPGYYAADGDAANSGAASGNVWRVHFAPDAVGTWTWKASFRTGKDVAISNDANAGEPVASIDGKTGAIEIAKTDKTGRDFRAHGRLDYVGERYLRFAGSGEWFLKAGADAPENFLAYEDFDNTPNHGNRRKSWKPHVRDWKPGDPTWSDGKGGDGRGKGMIGALNYLASEGLNAYSFMPMTIHGDDKNVFPYVTEDGPFDRFDCSKLDQWEIVFSHADRLGLYQHFKTLETENELLHDGGDLGRDRKLYYRMLIARYGHHLALNWNLGEEINDATTAQKKAWAAYFREHDPYRHHVVIHNGANHYDLLGPDSGITGFSLQTNKPDFAHVHGRTLDYIRRSREAAKPWVVACDEPGDASHSLRPDDDAGDSHEDGRRNGLWGNVMAGGAGTEWYFGYKHAHSDLTCNDYRSRDAWWDACRHQLEFFADNDVPFWRMESADDLLSHDGGYVLREAGKEYVVYLKSARTTRLDLTEAAGAFDVRWYDPRNGGKLAVGSVKSVTGGEERDLGQPPGGEPGDDWVVLLRRAR